MANWGCHSDGQVPLSFSVGGTQSTAQSCVTKSHVTTGSSGCRRHLRGGVIPGSEEYGGVSARDASPDGLLHTNGCACATPCSAPASLSSGTRAFLRPSPCPAACAQCRPPRVSPACCSSPLLAAFSPSRLFKFHLISVLLEMDVALVVLLVLWAGVRFLRREKCLLRVAVKLEMLPLWTVGAVVRAPRSLPLRFFLRADGRESEPPDPPDLVQGLVQGAARGASGLSEGRSRSPPS